MSYVGKEVLALEATELLKGGSKYIDDLGKDALHLGLIRSPYAHAKIMKIDASRAMRESLMIITNHEIEELFGNVRIPSDTYYPGKVVKMPALAQGKVKYVGEPVLGIVSRSRYEVEDLIELVSIEYDPLPPILDPMRALQKDSPVIHDDLKDNLSIETTIGSGDVDSAFGEADVVVEDELQVHRVATNPIEPRGVLANYENDRYTVIASCQGAFALKHSLTQSMNLPPEKVRVLQPEVGGAFGAKTSAYPEYILACLASRTLGRPVKWIETRSEHLLATQQGRDIYAKLSLASRRDGSMLAIRGSVTGDIGAYNFSVNPNHAPFVAQQIAGPYAIKAGHVVVKSVFTNKTPTGPFRGAGRPEAGFLIERMVDLLADELRLDAVELRRKNLVRLADMPHKTPFGLTLDVEDYSMIMDRSLDFLGYDEARKWTEEARQRGRLVGLGFADYVEINRVSIPESALVRIDQDERVTVITGLGPHGQGLRTVISQLVADEFETSISNINVLYGDSDLMARGTGTFASRSSSVGCAAIVSAAREVKMKAMNEAAAVLGCPVEKLEFSEFAIRKRNDPQSRVKLVELARKGVSLEASNMISGKDIFSFGVHLAIVEVDRETGKVKILSYKAVDDAGRILNPLIAEGQVCGGVLIGVGQVLYEEMDYDKDGQPLTGTIGDAGVPTAVEAPDTESLLVEFPSELPHHSRGIGEAGTIGALPTVVRAVENAIGVRLRTTHLSQEFIHKML